MRVGAMTTAKTAWHVGAGGQAGSRRPKGVGASGRRGNRRLNAELEQRVEERTAQLNQAKDRIEAILSNDVIILCRTDGTVDQVNRRSICIQLQVG
jgi:C4-dicarboxylate-specific signal transduction histidine kinase